MSEPLFDRYLTRLLIDLERYVPVPVYRSLTEGTTVERFKAFMSLDPQEYASDLQTFNAIALLKSTVKKHIGHSEFTGLVTNKDRQDAAIKGFLEDNQRCEGLNRRLSALSLCDNSFLNHLLSEAAWLLAEWFDKAGLSSVPLGTIAQGLRPGPGSSVGARGFDFYTKMGDSPLTYSNEGQMRLYREMLRHDPTALSCEQQRRMKHGDRDRLADSNTSTVPKEVETDRTICTEPSVPMLFQLETGRALETVLAHVGIRLSDQPDINRIMALLGSMDKSDQSFCTIDLKSASNSLYCELIRRLFIHLPDWRDWLFFIRSPYTLVGPEKVRTELHMISTMGNGYTFPLQTLIFAAITEVSYNLNGWAPRKKGCLQYGVFGDDIICRRGIYKTLSRALEAVGLIINPKKSFSEGDFRESCGHDWLNGIPVRPVFLEKLETTQNRVSLINRLMRFTAQTGLRLPRAVGFLYTTLHARSKRLVPMWEGDVSGIHATYLVARHSREIAAYQATTLRNLLEATNAGAWIYERDVPKVETRQFWRIRRGEWTELNNVNWSAVWLAILGGYVRGTGISLRQTDDVVFRSEFAVTPTWEPHPDSSQFAGWRGSVEAWKASVEYYHLMVFPDP